MPSGHGCRVLWWKRKGGKTGKHKQKGNHIYPWWKRKAGKGGNRYRKLPCTLNGFTGARNGQIIPEWSLSGEYVKPKKGAELHKVVNGKDTVVAIFDGKHFVEVKGK